MTDNNKLQEVWTVDESNSTNGYEDCTIYVVSSKEEAIRRCRILNKRGSVGCILTEEGDYLRLGDNYTEPYVYFNIGSFYIDDDFEE